MWEPFAHKPGVHYLQQQVYTHIFTVGRHANTHSSERTALAHMRSIRTHPCARICSACFWRPCTPHLQSKPRGLSMAPPVGPPIHTNYILHTKYGTTEQALPEFKEPLTRARSKTLRSAGRRPSGIMVREVLQHQTKPQLLKREASQIWKGKARKTCQSCAT